MGVHNLWQLLLPVGRRVSVETLERKVLAVDASIWLTQFIKAMRDDEGKVVKNAHLIGTFRRIVKLLFHRIKPVFVFDGGTPALKRRTVVARKERREHQETSLKKTAQRLLLAQLKKQHLAGKGGGAASQSAAAGASDVEVVEPRPPAASGRKRGRGAGGRRGGRRGVAASARERARQPTSRSRHEMAGDDRVAALAAMGFFFDDDDDSPEQQEGQGGGEEDDEGDVEWEEAEDITPRANASARSRAADAFAQALSDASDGEGVRSEEEEDPGEILLEDDNVDVAVLALLPPELQKDVIESAKRRQRMQSRQTFMPVAGNPVLYSQAQIASFLKSSALNQKVLTLKDVASPDGEVTVGERIASDGSKKFVIVRSTGKSRDGGWMDGDDEVVESDSGLKRPPNAQREEEEGRSSSATSTPGEKGAKRRRIVVDEGEDDDEDQLWADGKATPTRREEEEDAMQYGDDLGGGGFFPEDGELDDAPIQGGGFLPEPDAEAAVGAEAKGEPQTLRVPRGGFEETKRSGPPKTDDVKPPQPPPAAVDVEVVAVEKPLKPAATPESGVEVVSSSKEAQKKQDTKSVRRRQQELSEQEDKDLAYALHLSELEARRTKVKSQDVIHVDDAPSSQTPPGSDSKATASTSGASASKDDTDKEIVLTLTDVASAAPPPMLDEFLAALSAPSITASASSSATKASAKKANAGATAADMAGEHGRPVVSQNQALEMAMETASRLTTWAGRAMRSAIRQHMEVAPQPQQPAVQDDDEDFEWEEEGGEAEGGGVSIDVEREVMVELREEREVMVEVSEEGREGHDEVEVEVVAEEEEVIEVEVQSQGADERADKDHMDVLSDLEHRTVPASGQESIPAESCPCPEATATPPPPPPVKRHHSPSDVEVVESPPPPAKPVAPQGESPSPSQSQEASAAVGLSLEGEGGGGLSQEDVDVIEVEEGEDGELRVVVGGEGALSVDLTQGGEGMLEDLEDEETLRAQLKRQMRDAESVTQEMREEIMELLDLFGVPYVVAPMEAEAQCAVLETLGVVDGVISDDSDCFLFGARAVYKNMFDERKYVEAYIGADIERELGLRRLDMVSLAMLLGSDYTEGIRGVGIVNATEIIRAFPSSEDEEPEAGLKRFREWLDGFDPVKDLKTKGADEAPGDPVEAFHHKHRNARHRWVVGQRFPDPAIFKAYLQPQVNNLAAEFEWSLPDLDKIRLFAGKRLGWPVGDTDAMLLPMLGRMQERAAQTRIDSYFLTYQSNHKFAKIKSKRLRQTVGQLTGQAREREEEEEDEEEEEEQGQGNGKGKGKGQGKKGKKAPKTKGRGRRKRVKRLEDEVDTEEEEGEGGTEDWDGDDTE